MQNGNEFQKLPNIHLENLNAWGTGSMHASNYEHIRATTKHARSKNGNLMTAKCELLGRPSAVYKFSCINYKEDAAKMVAEYSIAHNWF